MLGGGGKAARVFVRNELLPLQKRICELNEWIGEKIISFEAYQLTIEH